MRQRNVIVLVSAMLVTVAAAQAPFKVGFSGKTSVVSGLSIGGRWQERDA